MGRRQGTRGLCKPGAMIVCLTKHKTSGLSVDRFMGFPQTQHWRTNDVRGHVYPDCCWC